MELTAVMEQKEPDMWEEDGIKLLTYSDLKLIDIVTQEYWEEEKQEEENDRAKRYVDNKAWWSTQPPYNYLDQNKYLGR